MTCYHQEVLICRLFKSVKFVDKIAFRVINKHLPVMTLTNPNTVMYKHANAKPANDTLYLKYVFQPLYRITKLVRAVKINSFTRLQKEYGTNCFWFI